MKYNLLYLLLFILCISCEKEETLPDNTNKIDIADHHIITDIFPLDGTSDHVYFLEPYVITSKKDREIVSIGNKDYKALITYTLTEGSRQIGHSVITKGDTTFIWPKDKVSGLNPNSSYTLLVNAAWLETADGTNWVLSHNKANKPNRQEKLINFRTTETFQLDYTDNLTTDQIIDPISSFKIDLRTQFSYPHIRTQLTTELVDNSGAILESAGYWEGKTYHHVPKQIMKSNESYTLKTSLVLEYLSGSEWKQVEVDGIVGSLSKSTAFKTKVAPAMPMIKSIELGSDPANYSIYGFPTLFTNFTYYELSKNYKPTITAEFISNGTSIGCETVSSANDFDQLLIHHNTPLPANSPVDFKGKVNWSYWNGTEWLPVVESTTNNYNQPFSYALTTSASATTTIPKENVSYSYPIDRQYHFLKAEQLTGYLKLKFRQPDLDRLIQESASLRMVIEPVPATGTSYYTSNLTYNSTTMEFSFQIPQDLANEKIYKLALVAVNSTPQEFYTMHFRTSMFNTWEQKVLGWEKNKGWVRGVAAEHYEVGQTIFGPEFFDKFEKQSLMSFEADLSTITYFNDVTFPLLYKDYATLPLQLTWRKVASSGVVPAKEAVYLRNYDVDIHLTDADIAAGTAPRRGQESAIIQELDYYFLRDFKDYKAQLETKYDPANEWMTAIKNHTFKYLPAGDYPYKCVYTLPGKTEKSSEETLILNIPF